MNNTITDYMLEEPCYWWDYSTAAYNAVNSVLKGMKADIIEMVKEDEQEEYMEGKPANLNCIIDAAFFDVIFEDARFGDGTYAAKKAAQDYVKGTFSHGRLAIAIEVDFFKTVTEHLDRILEEAVPFLLGAFVDDESPDPDCFDDEW